MKSMFCVLFNIFDFMIEFLFQTNGALHFIGDLSRFSGGFAHSRSARPHGLRHLVSERQRLVSVLKYFSVVVNLGG